MGNLGCRRCRQRDDRRSAAGEVERRDRDLSKNQWRTHAGPTAPISGKEGPRWERLCRREEDREAHEPQPPLRHSSGRAPPTASPGPPRRSNLCPQKSAARAAAAGPVRTCHPVGRHQPRGSRPALRPPRATAATATPFPYQVSPFRSEVLSSVAMSDRWVSRSAAPPSAIFFH